MDNSLQKVLYGSLRRGPTFARLRQGTFVSTAHKLMYMATPKNACTSTKILFGELINSPPLERAKVHPRPIDDKRPSVLNFDPKLRRAIVQSNDYFRFCIFRNPVNRLLSGYKNKMSRKFRRGPIFKIQSDILNANRKTNLKDITFDMFANYILDQPDAERNEHWKSQNKLALMPEIDYHFVATFENYSRDMKHVLDKISAPKELYNSIHKVHNKSPNSEVNISSDLRKKIELAFAVDMDIHEQALTRNSRLNAKSYLSSLNIFKNFFR